MRYVSLLRGINVSGQKIIKMADLKTLYQSLDFENVVTYIQSGNVIFDSIIKNPDSIKTKIEGAIEKKHGFQVPVQIRTNQEIEQIIKGCPFGSIDLVKDGTKALVTFLLTVPPENRVRDIQIYVKAPEKLLIKGKEVYLYCPNGYGRSKLTNTFLEKKLGINATTRNFKSLHKLYELSI